MESDGRQMLRMTGRCLTPGSTVTPGGPRTRACGSAHGERRGQATRGSSRRGDRRADRPELEDGQPFDGMAWGRRWAGIWSMQTSLMRTSSRRRWISCRGLSSSAFSRMRALILFAATLRAWVGEICGREIVRTTADRTRGDRFSGRGSSRSQDSLDPRAPAPDQGSSRRSFAARSRSSRKLGWAMPISALARSRRFLPNRLATPYSVTT